MTTLQSTGSMVFPSPPKEELRLRCGVCGGEQSWYRTPVDVGSTAPALREAVTKFSGALDCIGEIAWIAVTTDLSGHTSVLGPLPRLAVPYLVIGVPATPAQVNEKSDILEAFEQIRAELGVTQEQMFKATGIKHRTYHSWKQKAVHARPRAASLGRFWRLVDVLNDLRDAVDRPLSQWLCGAPERLSAFLDGRFDELVDIAVNRPAYPKRSIGDSVRIGIAEEVDTPVIRTGKTNIIDVEDGI